MTATPYCAARQANGGGGGQVSGAFGGVVAGLILVLS
jgi:hypothetical protein